MAKGKKKTRRRGNVNLKARRAASWARTRVARALQGETQKQAENRNRKLRAAGDPTPWEEAKAARAARRAQDPDVQRRVRNSRQAQRENA